MNTSTILKEIQCKAIRSSGAGGQHVNKVSSKIELSFDISNSEAFTEEEKLILNQKLSSRLTKTGILILACGDTRSQHRNKELVIQRLLDVLKAGLHIPKKRKASKPTKSSIRKRLESKKKHAQKKANRRKPPL